jgi:hypothetical protein
MDCCHSSHLTLFVVLVYNRDMNRWGRMFAVLLVIAIVAAPMSASVCAMQCVSAPQVAKPAVSASHCGSARAEETSSDSSLTSTHARSVESGAACHLDGMPIASTPGVHEGLKPKSGALNPQLELLLQQSDAKTREPIGSPPSPPSRLRAIPLRI